MARLSAILSSPSDIFWCCAKVWNISTRTDGVSAFITNICVKTKYNVEVCYEKLCFIWSLFFFKSDKKKHKYFYRSHRFLHNFPASMPVPLQNSFWYPKPSNFHNCLGILHKQTKLYYPGNMHSIQAYQHYKKDT